MRLYRSVFEGENEVDRLSQIKRHHLFERIVFGLFFIFVLALITAGVLSLDFLEAHINYILIPLLLLIVLFLAVYGKKIREWFEK